MLAGLPHGHRGGAGILDHLGLLLRATRQRSQPHTRPVRAALPRLESQRSAATRLSGERFLFFVFSIVWRAIGLVSIVPCFGRRGIYSPCRCSFACKSVFSKWVSRYIIGRSYYTRRKLVPIVPCFRRCSVYSPYRRSFACERALFVTMGVLLCDWSKIIIPGERVFDRVGRSVSKQRSDRIAYAVLLCLCCVFDRHHIGFQYTTVYC